MVQKCLWDIYEEPKRLEATSIGDNSQSNRLNLSKARAEFTRFLQLQDSVLGQKTRVKWRTEGDENIDFFHGAIKDRRKMLSTIKIKDDNGNCVEGTS